MYETTESTVRYPESLTTSLTVARIRGDYRAVLLI